MYIIGIFGKIGAGKSSFIELLKQYIEADFLSADEENRELLKQREYIQLLKEHFPDCFVGNELNKELLKTKIFADSFANEKLRLLSHSAIKSKLYSKICASSKKIVFVEISVFVDNFLDFDEKWLVTCSKNRQIKRLSKRDSICENIAEQRVSAQYLPDNDYFDRIIINDGTLEQLSNTTKDIVRELKTSLNIGE